MRWTKIKYNNRFQQQWNIATPTKWKEIDTDHKYWQRLKRDKDIDLAMASFVVTTFSHLIFGPFHQRSNQDLPDSGWIMFRFFITTSSRASIPPSRRTAPTSASTVSATWLLLTNFWLTPTLMQRSSLIRRPIIDNRSLVAELDAMLCPISGRLLVRKIV